MLREAAAMYRKVVEADHPQLVNTLDLLAQVLVWQRKFAEAEPMR